MTTIIFGWAMLVECGKLLRVKGDLLRLKLIANESYDILSGCRFGVFEKVIGI